MGTPVPIHDRDLRVLTAKALSFRAIVRYEASSEGKLRAETRRPLLLHVSNLQALQACSRNGQDLHAALEEIAHALETYLQLHLESLQSARIVALFREDIPHYHSILHDLGAWLDSMLQYANRYVPTPPSPSPNILLGASQFQDPPTKEAISAVTQRIDVGRHITIYLKAEEIDFDRYFEIPCVLSHEFWCHSLSSIDSLGGVYGHCWQGCDPEDSWEEGWMDYIQVEIYQAEDFPLPLHCHSWLLPALHKATQTYEDRTRPENGFGRSRGWGAAYQTRRFFRQQYRENEPDEMFFRFSIDLNKLQCGPILKQRIVEFFLNYLANPEIPDPSFPPMEQIVSRRKMLGSVLSSCLKSDSAGRPERIDVTKLLRIVENY